MSKGKIDTGGDVFCYAAGADPASERSPIHYLAEGVPVTVCGATPGKRLPYIPLARQGSKHDPKGVADGWNWCETCCRIMMKPIVKAPVAQSEKPAVVSRRKKARVRH